MKRILILLLVGLLVASCGPKPQYKTRQGKQKLKRYNALQFNKADHDKAKKKPKKLKKKN